MNFELIPVFNNDKWLERRIFRRDSCLRFYLGTKLPDRKYHVYQETTLRSVFNSLKSIIQREQMFDPNNPTIIMADQSLELALSVRYFHKGELERFILVQFMSPSYDAHDKKPLSHHIPVREARLITFGNEEASLNFIISRVLSGQYQGQAKKTSFVQGSYAVLAAKPQCMRPKMTPVTHDMPPNDSQYRVKPMFLNVLLSLNEENVPTLETVFTFLQLKAKLTKYVLSHIEEHGGTRMFDARHVLVCYCDGTLLGKAFGVKAFHRCQVRQLLLTQLIPVKNV